MLDDTDSGLDLRERQTLAASVTQPAVESARRYPNISFEELYRDWRSHVVRWVRTLGARSADSDDLVQEIFLVASRGLSRFDGSNPGGWLFSIAWRKVRDYRDLAWNRRLFGRNCAPASDDLLMNLNHPLVELEVREVADRIDCALASMSLQQRSTFLLFSVEGQTGDEIARSQNLPINTVWARLRRTRVALEKQMRHLGIQPLVANPGARLPRRG